MTAERQSYQERVACLLERVEAYSRKRLRLETAGVRPPLLTELERKEADARARLAELVAHPPRVAKRSEALYL